MYEKFIKDKKTIIKYNHKLLLTELLYLNHLYSTFDYDNITEYNLLKEVIKETKYNRLEQLEILEDAKMLLRIKYNLIITK